MTTEANQPTLDRTKPVGIPLYDYKNVDQLRDAVENLWSFLDDIDTLIDTIKPRNQAGYMLFYKEVMEICEKRGNFANSDGHSLFMVAPEA